MSRGFRITVAIAGIVGIVAFPTLMSAWTMKTTFITIWLEVLCVTLVAAATTPPAISSVMCRALAGFIFLTFVGYLTIELISSGGRITFTKPSQHSVVSALAGLVFIGLPCLKFALKGDMPESDASESKQDPET